MCAMCQYVEFNTKSVETVLGNYIRPCIHRKGLNMHKKSLKTQFLVQFKNSMFNLRF